MKRKIPVVIFAVVVMLMTMLAVYAENTDSVFTQHNVVLSYDDETKTVRADIYISKGTAIVGYCSFKYDSDVLALKDIHGERVLSGNVPDFGKEGNIYLTDIVEANSGIVITDIGKGTHNLVNPEEGYFMFAWFLPGNISSLNADGGAEVLIASVNFDLIKDITYEEFDKDTFWVAGNEVTDRIGGWYPGIVVMNDKNKQFVYDGTVEDGDLFLIEYGLQDLDGNNLNGEKAEEKAEEKDDSSDVSDKTENVTGAEEEKTPAKDDIKSDEKHPEENGEKADEAESEKNNSDSGSYAENTGNQEKSDVKTQKADFDLKITTTETAVTIGWTVPSKLAENKIDGITAVLCDDDFQIVKKVDIFPSSTSYTFKNLRDGYKYKLYFYVSGNGTTYCSDIFNAETPSAKEFVAPIFTVSYSAGKGQLFGLDEEQVVFGENLTKVPDVKPPSGTYFVCWSADGENEFDVNSAIYEDLRLSAIYSTERNEKKSAYITGYTDGTFKPNGSISRAEAAVLIARICSDYDENKTYEHKFSDCKKGSWYENAVAYCSSKKYITGYTDGTFKPNGNISRAEFVSILARVFDLKTETVVNPFSDTSEHWAGEYVAELFSAGVVNPDANGRFRPNEALERKDAVLFLNKCLGIIPDKSSVEEYVKENGYKFTDVEQYSDYFYSIMAATMK